MIKKIEKRFKKNTIIPRPSPPHPHEPTLILCVDISSIGSAVLEQGELYRQAYIFFKVNTDTPRNIIDVVCL